MSTSRLSKFDRDAIRNGLLKNAFAGKIEDLRQRRANHAAAVYEACFTTADLARINGMPEGWLPTDDDVAVQYDHAAASRVKLAFNGLGYDWYFNRSLYQNQNHVFRRFPASRKGQCLKVFLGSESVVVAGRQLLTECGALVEEVQKASSNIEGTLSAFSTAGALLKAWPEVEPFIAKYTPTERQLPMVPRDQLNRMLDLPVEALV